MADDYSIKPRETEAPVQATQINASQGIGIIGQAGDGRVINAAVPARLQPSTTMDFLMKVGAPLLEPIIKQQEQAKYLQGMARAVAGETAADIDHERPAGARAFGDSAAVSGARAYEGATDASRLESALYTAMPDLVKRDGGEVAQEASNIITKMRTGDPVRDQAMNAMLPQILPNVLRMHATGRAKYLQDEAERVDTENKVGVIRSFYAAEEALKNTPALDSTDAQVLSQNNKNLADALMTPGPGQDPSQFMKRSASVLLADIAGGNFGAMYTALDHGLLDKLEVTNPGLGPKMMDALRKEETAKLKQTAFITNPDLAVVMARLHAGTAGSPEDVQKLVSVINGKVADAAGVRYGKFIDGDNEAQYIGAAVREEEQQANELKREARADQRAKATEARAAARDAAKERRAEEKEAARQAKEDLEAGALDGYRNQLLEFAAAPPGTDSSNSRVRAQAFRDFLKSSKVKEWDTDKIEDQAFTEALQQGPGPATKVLSLLPGGQVPKRFKDRVSSGQSSGAPDSLIALQAYARVKDNPDLVARIWDKPQDAMAIRESYERLEQGGKLEALGGLPQGAPPELEKRFTDTRTAAGKELSLLAQERKSRDMLTTLGKAFDNSKDNVAKAQGAVRTLTSDTYGSKLSPISRSKIEQMVAWQVGHLMGHDGVSPQELVKQAWQHVEDRALPVGTKFVALPVDPSVPGMSTLGLSAPKARATEKWDNALLTALAEKAGGAKFKAEDVKEIYYGKSPSLPGADLYIHAMIGGRLVTIQMNEFEVRKHVKE